MTSKQEKDSMPVLRTKCPWFGMCGYYVNANDKFATDMLADHIADHELPQKNTWMAELLAKALVKERKEKEMIPIVDVEARLEKLYEERNKQNDVIMFASKNARILELEDLISKNKNQGAKK
jgi:hypothetical protein